MLSTHRGGAHTVLGTPYYISPEMCEGKVSELVETPLCTVLYCTVLYCTALYCSVLLCTVLYCAGV